MGSVDYGRTLDSLYGLYVVVALSIEYLLVTGHVVETHHVFGSVMFLFAVVMY